MDQALDGRMGAATLQWRANVWDDTFIVMDFWPAQDDETILQAYREVVETQNPDLKAATLFCGKLGNGKLTGHQRGSLIAKRA